MEVLGKHAKTEIDCLYMGLSLDVYYRNIRDTLRDSWAKIMLRYPSINLIWVYYKAFKTMTYFYMFMSHKLMAHNGTNVWYQHSKITSQLNIKNKLGMVDNWIKIGW